MPLIKWTPRGLSRSEEELSNLFEDFLRPLNEVCVSDGLSWQPTANITESKDAYQVSVDLPGINKDDIKVDVENNVLTISGKRQQEKKEEGKEYHRVERHYGSFCRSFDLSTKVATEKISAAYKDGVLNVSVPKAAEAKKKVIKVGIE